MTIITTLKKHTCTHVPTGQTTFDSCEGKERKRK